MIKPAKQIKVSHHDRFFKKVFSDSKFILDLLGLAFSKKELSVFDLSRLQLEKDSWANRAADLVVSLPLKNSSDRQIKICILLEHKTQYHADFFSQLYSYLHALHEHTRKIGHPWPVYCVVFYHGKAPWNHPKSFQEGLWGDIFEKYPLFPRRGMVDYEIRFIDGRSKEFQPLIKKLRAYAPLNLMDRIWFLKNSPVEIKSSLALFGEFSGLNVDLMLDVMEYLESAGVIDPALWNSIENELVLDGIFKRGGFMNTREEIRQRGVQEGLRQGMQKGQQSVALNMLRNSLDISLISQMTGLSEKEIKQLKNGST